MPVEPRRGRGLAQTTLAVAAVGLYFMFQATAPDDVWDKVRPVAALGLGATLLGLAVDAARSYVGVSPPMASGHRRHIQSVERVTDPAFERADTAIRAFVDEGTLLADYEHLFARTDVDNAPLLARARDLAGMRPRGTRPVAFALASGGAVVAACTLALLTLLPDHMAAEGAILTLAIGLYLLQVRGVTAGARWAVAACALAGAGFMQAFMARVLGVPYWPAGFEVRIVIPLGMLVLSSVVVLTMGARTSATWEQTRRRLRRDTDDLRRRALYTVVVALVLVLVKNPVDRLFLGFDMDIARVLSATVIVTWGAAAYFLIELVGVHVSLYVATQHSTNQRRRRVEVHEALLANTLASTERTTPAPAVADVRPRPSP